MKHRLSYLISRYVAEDYKRRNKLVDMNYVNLSKKTGCTISSLWFYFNEKRRWPADSWIRTMYEMGAIEVHPDCIVISFPVKSTWKDFLNDAAG